MALWPTFVLTLASIAPLVAASEDVSDVTNTEGLSVEARYLSTPEPTLEFTVRSRRAERFLMFEANLPWGNANSVRLSFVRPSGGEPCPLYTAPIDDPSDTQIWVEPGATLEGSVSLDTYCPAILDVLAESTLVIHWQYCPVLGSDDTPKAEGTITAPRSAPSKGP